MFFCGSLTVSYNADQWNVTIWIIKKWGWSYKSIDRLYKQLKLTLFSKSTISSTLLISGREIWLWEIFGRYLDAKHLGRCIAV
jgi:hypothetical protein